MGWHGSSEESLRRIAQTGFLEPHELEAAGIKTSDPGWFGPGIYLTQFPSHGAKYALQRKSNCMLVSWALLGHTLPVIEQPGTLKARVEPYDSHYVVVDATYGTPSKPGDTSIKDEIVLFSKNQVLPRYFFFFEQDQKQSDGVPPQLRTAYPIVLWIDVNLQAIDQTATVLRGVMPHIEVIKCSSAGEAAVWLGRFGRLVIGRLAIITNRFREDDGGDLAWRRIIETARGAGFGSTTVVVYCREPERVQATSFRNVVVTNDPLVVSQALAKIGR
jgi:hypothetical protein